MLLNDYGINLFWDSYAHIYLYPVKTLRVMVAISNGVSGK